MTSRPDRRYLNRSTPPHLSTLILLASMTALTMNIFLPSLPNIAAFYDAPYRVVQLSVAIFLAANGVTQIFIGPMADKWGRRPLILWGLALFCLSTLGCIYAPDVYTFLTFRVLQATVAVAMVLSRAVVRDTNSADRAAAMMGWVTMGMSVVPMVAPAIGGVMDQALGWKSTFWLLFAAGLIVFTIVYFDLGETGKPSDLTIWRQFGEYPELLTSPRFWGYCLASAFSSGAFFAFLGGAPYVASDVFGMTPAQFGVYSAVPAIGYFSGNFLTGAISARVGMNRMIITGSLILIFGMAGAVTVTLIGWGGPMVFFGVMFFVGLGNGMTIPSASAGMLSVRPHLAGTASGLGGAIMIGGGAALSAIAGVVLGPGRGEMPLLVLMLLTGVAGLLSILSVIWRERSLRMTPGA